MTFGLKIKYFLTWRLLIVLSSWWMFRRERCLGQGRSRGGGIKKQNSRCSHQIQIHSHQIQIQKSKIHPHYVEIKNAFTSNTNSHKSYIQSHKCCGQTAHSSAISAIHWWNQKDRHSAVAITRTNFIITNVVITRNIESEGSTRVDNTKAPLITFARWFSRHVWMINMRTLFQKSKAYSIFFKLSISIYRHA